MGPRERRLFCLLGFLRVKCCSYGTIPWWLQLIFWLLIYWFGEMLFCRQSGVAGQEWRAVVDTFSIFSQTFIYKRHRAARLWTAGDQCQLLNKSTTAKPLAPLEIEIHPAIGLRLTEVRPTFDCWQEIPVNLHIYFVWNRVFIWPIELWSLNTRLLHPPCRRRRRCRLGSSGSERMGMGAGEKPVRWLNEMMIYWILSARPSRLLSNKFRRDNGWQ